jgi:hypothetical protein
LRPGAASETDGKDGEVGRGVWQERHRNPGGPVKCQGVSCTDLHIYCPAIP